ncbi:hypothetical protein TAO_1784 [Candidatus Nitrosoglobus terrae]|uniref:Uncharacterized protein n=1 Tax=Candidatus Nitrosoglobus terrae TaxID=1630141 RepID=A0A1Q2SPU2_9GAMM|nr:DUF6607 family protein [Candidatus Nitrosoglobus terrae]BAW81154.1 hypothetical protein TAO_1784 [Candidatus Nitrosoglobus terrae]
MNYRYLLRWGFIIIFGNGVNIALADPLPKGIENVENLSGCFDVTYRFAEDGVHDLFSKKHQEGIVDKPSREWISFKHGEEDTFILQHVTFNDKQEPNTHFHEEWQYNPDKETWTQKVWSTAYGNKDRKLRYQCSAPWEMNQWQCHAGQAEKPFRDNGAPFGFNRTDYDHLDRNNTILVTPNGWIQSEHNAKRSSSHQIVSRELGWITYQRLENEACKTAIKPFPREVSKQ